MNNINHPNMKSKEKKVESIKIEIEFDTPHDIMSLASQKDFITFIYDNTLDKIEEAIKLKLKRIELIEIRNLFYSIEIERKQYKPILEKILNLYESSEDYDTCIRISNLIKKL
jgi:hypothetical protein